MTRDAVVVMSGLSLRTIAYAEDGDRPISPATLATLHRVYGVNGFSELQGGPMA